MFAGSCIGVIGLVMSLEFLRRVGREHDLLIARQAAGVAAAAAASPVPALRSGATDPETPKTPATSMAPRPSVGEGRLRLSRAMVHHVVRTVLHTLQFGVAYIVMLLAMYYNGYIIICIFVGAFLGAFVFAWDAVTVPGVVGGRFEYVFSCSYLLSGSGG